MFLKNQIYFDADLIIESMCFDQLLFDDMNTPRYLWISTVFSTVLSIKVIYCSHRMYLKLALLLFLAD